MTAHKNTKTYKKNEERKGEGNGSNTGLSIQ